MMRRSLGLSLCAVLAVIGCDNGTTEDAGPAGRDGGMRDGGQNLDAAPGDAGVDGGPGQDSGQVVDPCEGAGPPTLATEAVGNFSSPVFVTHAPGDDGAIYVVEQGGRVQRVTAGGTEQFMSLSVEAGGERGLLGLAFHPQYASNGRYFLYYTPSDRSHNTVAEFHRDMGDTVVQTLLSADDPQSNHNGGGLMFGPDGYLYAGVGDGGGAGDQHGSIGNGLDTNSVFGKLHRFDVDNAPSFSVSTNPFAGGGGLATIWAYGLRNPWRFSFDRQTGDLWIGDVGQGAWEEIDFQPAASTGGENYGWRAYEGFEVYSSGEVSLVEQHAEPLYVYSHGSGHCSVTGGYVYRGSAISGLRGYYVFADYCSGEVWALRSCGGTPAEAIPVLGPIETGISNITSFGEDADGEMYITGAGAVARIIGG